jgi:hypothetical protein
MRGLGQVASVCITQRQHYSATVAKCIWRHVSMGCEFFHQTLSSYESKTTIIICELIEK